jgi:hypothetical protein
MQVYNCGNVLLTEYFCLLLHLHLFESSSAFSSRFGQFRSFMVFDISIRGFFEVCTTSSPFLCVGS